MSMIPKHIAKIVEWHLKNANCIRANAFAEAEALRASMRIWNHLKRCKPRIVFVPPLPLNAWLMCTHTRSIS